MPLQLYARIRRHLATSSDATRTAVRRLATARFISLAGTDATGVAVGFALYEQTHSPRWLSLSLLLTIGAGALLAPLGGLAGDLFDRRKLMIGAELFLCAIFLALAVLHTPVALLALGLLASGVSAVVGPASGAAIAHIAGERQLAWANGVIATGANLGKTIGRLVAGALISAFGPAGVFVLDAVTYLLSAWMIRGVRRAFSAPLTEPPIETAEPPAQRGGFRLLLSHRTLRLLVASACISTFATGFSMTAEVPLVFELGAGAIGLGALTACWAAGMIAGSWYAGRVLHDGNEATGVLCGRLAMAAGVGMVAFTPSLWPMLACYLLGGAGGGLMGVASQSMVLRQAPDQVRARLLGTIDSCRNVAFGIGVIGAGAVVTLVGPRPVYALVGVAMFLGALPVAALVLRLGGPRRLRAGAPA
jgi:MFS family permease